ncbi:GFA family protein [Parahaliea aestuarii]|uniref:GFA family protein n=1 Tax=Parahaliea aestuarii TaxID=1852021 RepID=A0A5C9A390_9GAMM|nr:GFA family protein [Parahaliea aestuarii]TXS94412.1 GFA family protein [Parahaliea aestuarii]
MQNPLQHRGSCLCGAVSITATSKSEHIEACHCDMCRKWGGGPLLAVECAGDVSIDGNDHISIFSSSEWAERGFCRHCGTHLFYRLKEGDHYALPVGLLDSEADWELTGQIFIDQKPAYYDFAQHTRNLSGEEVFAQFAKE